MNTLYYSPSSDTTWFSSFNFAMGATGCFRYLGTCISDELKTKSITLFKPVYFPNLHSFLATDPHYPPLWFSSARGQTELQYKTHIDWFWIHYSLMFNSQANDLRFPSCTSHSNPFDYGNGRDGKIWQCKRIHLNDWGRKQLLKLGLKQFKQ